MDQISNKINIQLESWEADMMNTALKYLIECHFKNPDNFKEVPEDSLKATSWLIAWKYTAFQDKGL